MLNEIINKLGGYENLKQIEANNFIENKQENLVSFTFNDDKTFFNKERNKLKHIEITLNNEGKYDIKFNTLDKDGKPFLIAGYRDGTLDRLLEIFVNGTGLVIGDCEIWAYNKNLYFN